MGSSSAKKIVKKNKAAIRWLVGAYLVIMFAYGASHYTYNSATYSSFQFYPYCISNLVTLGIILYLDRIGQPVRDSQGAVVGVGHDLTAQGITEYLFDVIYVIWAVHILTIWWYRAWYLCLVIPAFASYKIAGFVFPFLRGMLSGPLPSSEEDIIKEKKKRAKKERQQGKVKYVRR